MRSNPCLEITAEAVAWFQYFGFGQSFVIISAVSQPCRYAQV